MKHCVWQCVVCQYLLYQSICLSICLHVSRIGCGRWLFDVWTWSHGRLARSGLWGVPWASVGTDCVPVRLSPQRSSPLLRLEIGTSLLTAFVRFSPGQAKFVGSPRLKKTKHPQAAALSLAGQRQSRGDQPTISAKQLKWNYWYWSLRYILHDLLLYVTQNIGPFWASLP